MPITSVFLKTCVFALLNKYDRPLVSKFSTLNSIFKNLLFPEAVCCLSCLLSFYALKLPKEIIVNGTRDKNIHCIAI